MTARKRTVLFRAIVAICAFGANSTAQPLSPAPADKILDNIVETVEFHNAPTVDILRLLARQNELNLIIGPDSMGSVSLRFSGVSLRSALDAILRAKGYQYQVFENILLVTRPDSLEKIRGLGMETRLFQLKYSDARDIKSTIDSAKVLSPWGHTNIYFKAVATEAIRSSAFTPRSQAGTATIPNLADPIAKASAPLGTRSDVLLVTDMPANLRRVTELIEQLDKPIRQLAIDVQFVETILTDDQQMGIDWQQLLRAQGAYKGKTMWDLGSYIGSPAGGAIEFGSLSDSRFSAVLEMLMKSQRTKLLSQPRLSTMDNQPASISVGITTWIEERRGGTGTAELQITYSERRVPIELIVVPHIIHNDKVLLEIRPMVEEITGWQEGFGGLKLPLISTRTADSRIEVADGETAVIGGLIKDRTAKTVKKVWLLGSLPLIGNLFRYEVDAVERTDLSIFITPRILREGELQLKPMEDPTLKSGDEESEEVSEVRKDKTRTELAKSEPEIEKKQAPQKVDLRPYFPIIKDANWSYNWNDGSGNRWASSMKIDGNPKGYWTAVEVIPEGSYKSEARTAYRWDEKGLLNLHKVNSGRDSIVYEGGRVVIPAEAIIGVPIESSCRWTSWTENGRGASGEIVQQQRLLKKQSVTTQSGYYPDCVAIETVWFDPADKVGLRRRKVVWYAEGVGPVKVESDIPVNSSTLKGKTSGLLSNR